jgi:uncharacterized membrane protein YhaH (DUF805 family)
MKQPTPSLSFTQALNSSVNNVFKTTGRARRSEFWWTQLVVYIASFVLTPFMGTLLSLFTIPLTIRRLHDTGRSGWWWGAGALFKLVFFIFFFYEIILIAINSYGMPEVDAENVLTVTLKYMAFLLCIAIYDIIVLVFCCLDSDQEENEYGPSSKYVDEQQ